MMMNHNPTKIILSNNELTKLKDMAMKIRLAVLKMARVKRVHIGPAFSIAEILSILYFRQLRYKADDSNWIERDRFILSKGHGALALYGALSEAGILDRSFIEHFGEKGNILAGHPVLGIPGVDVPTGSLGHGLSIGAGLALGAKLNSASYKTVVLLGDGEINEGSVWEAAAFAAHRQLNNLIAIIDKNGYQQEGSTYDILDMEPLADKWKAFNWYVMEVDGHNFNDLAHVLDYAFTYDKSPSIIIASTIKGKGISFMENDPSWHMGWLQGDMYKKSVDALRMDDYA